MYADRVNLYKKLEDVRDSKVVGYVTGDRRGLESQIAADVVDFFVHHLDEIGVVNKISLLLYTRGGDTLTAWSLANLFRSFCDHFEVIVPSKARSAGTLICLAADSIVMTKQATLGPIDPSVNTPLNPQLPGGKPGTRVPVSVEDVNSFLELARQSLRKRADLTPIIQLLAKSVDPIVLGNAFRARTQIRMLGQRLLASHMNDEKAIQKILGFLCSESGSHDYTVNRREAEGDLGLPIAKPSQELYDCIKEIYNDIALELELTVPYDPNVMLGGGQTKDYSFKRALIESVDGGMHEFFTEGRLTKQQVQVTPGVMADAVKDERSFEGWRHSNV